MRLLWLCLLVVMSVQVASAEVVGKDVEYTRGNLTLKGYVAVDTSRKDPVPGILVVHQWMGVTDYEKSRCRQLAELGYIAFALDVYGADVRPANPQAAAATAGIYKSDRALFRDRLALGLEQLRLMPQVDKTKIAAIGYCFGGTGVLELARSGATLSGVVSFHGGLDSPNPEDGQNVEGKVLICHGADDPFVPKKDIDAFVNEMNEAKVDWQMIYYSGAVHSFTQPMAGNDNSRGAAYNENADRRSWAAMNQFFSELFQR